MKLCIPTWTHTHIYIHTWTHTHTCRDIRCNEEHGTNLPIKLCISTMHTHTYIYRHTHSCSDIRCNEAHGTNSGQSNCTARRTRTVPSAFTPIITNGNGIHTDLDPMTSRKIGVTSYKYTIRSHEVVVRADRIPSLSLSSVHVVVSSPLAQPIDNRQSATRRTHQR